MQRLGNVKGLYARVLSNFFWDQADKGGSSLFPVHRTGLKSTSCESEQPSTPNPERQICHSTWEPVAIFLLNSHDPGPPASEQQNCIDWVDGTT
eukprot:387095-Pelagomonas_calceolata.AAC.5